MLECIPRPLLFHSSKPSTSGRSDKESTSPGRCENFRRLDWFPPTNILVKILLQRLWEEKRACDAPVPPVVEQAAAYHIPRDATTQGCQSRIHAVARSWWCITVGLRRVHWSPIYVARTRPLRKEPAGAHHWVDSSDPIINIGSIVNCLGSKWKLDQVH